MPTNTLKARVMTLEEYDKKNHQLPASWYKAAGLLRGKRKAMERHLRQIRKEWDRYPAKA